jgi:glycosyltransferase involved in cell wall biosynthesis
VPPAFPVDDFRSGLDPGAVKARFQVGPVDPTVLFIGSLDDRHGPDILLNAARDVLKTHPQVRFIFVGDGPLLWPLRVHARYLQLEYCVRLVGHMEGKALYELVAACDIVCLPSRESTGDWPILAAWAAKRPVVATHNAGGALIQHDQDGVLFYPSENSCVWSIDRILRDDALRERLRENGHQSLLARHGWGKAAQQIEELLQK